MRGRGTVLIIEDNAAVRSMLEFALSMEGYDVTSLPDGSDLARAMDPPPDLVVLDVMMPGRSGFELLGDLRAAKETKDLPVILVTALGDPASQWSGWTAGCAYYLTKPFDSEELLAVVRRVITGMAA